LDREFKISLDSLEKQKAEAKRWLVRQQVRLEAQTEEVQQEKTVIAGILAQELKDYRLMMMSL
jgi:hypothetical protein